MKRSILQQLNFNDSLIDEYIKDGSIIIDNTNILINSSILAVDMFTRIIEGDNYLIDTLLSSISNKNIRNFIILLNKLYNKDISDIELIIDSIDEHVLDNESRQWFNLIKYIFSSNKNINIDKDIPYLNGYNKLFIYYINDKEYKLACSLLKQLINQKNNIYLSILSNILDTLPDNLYYIVDEEDIKDEVTLEGIRKIERDALVLLEENQLSEFVEKLNLLKIIMPNTITKNIFLLLIQLNKFLNDKKYVSNHKFENGFGPIDELILDLINFRDFYRVQDLVLKYERINHHSIKYRIYKMLINRIMRLNERNSNFLKTITELSITSDNYQEVLRDKHMNRMDVSLIQEESTGIDFKHNYFKLYLKYKEDGNFKEARRCLIQFKINMEYMNVKYDVDYLIRELEVKEANKYVTEREKSIIDSLHRRLDETNNPIDKIRICQELLKYDNIKNPHTLIYIAKIYRSLGKLEDAVNYYFMAENVYLYPDDYIDIIELLIEIGNYEKAIEYAFKYQFYKEDENGYIHYLMSIAYIHLKKYDFAKDCLREIKHICLLCNNVEYDLSMELKTIKDLQDGKRVSIYSKDDFIDFTLTNDEEQIREDIEDKNGFDIHDTIATIGTDDKIDYLMSVIKVCNYLDNKNTGEEALKIAYSLLNNDDDIKHKDLIKRQLSIYRENFTQKKL